jgi:hypothetical protein
MNVGTRGRTLAKELAEPSEKVNRCRASHRLEVIYIHYHSLINHVTDISQPLSSNRLPPHPLFPSQPPLLRAHPPLHDRREEGGGVEDSGEVSGVGVVGRSLFALRLPHRYGP